MRNIHPDAVAHAEETALAIPASGHNRDTAQHRQPPLSVNNTRQSCDVSESHRQIRTKIIDLRQTL